MYSALPKESALKWDKVRDNAGFYIIPYVISGDYDLEERQIITRAMNAIEQNTCIRFQKRMKQPSFIDLQNKYNEGCYTSVGRFPGRNIVMLEANNVATCIEYDIVLHELLHAVGLWHEHMRGDRDQFIKIHFENIQPGMYSQFEKVPSISGDTYGIRYDYQSVMHYAKDAFAVSPGAITMETVDPRFQNIIGKARDATASDYYKVCATYECPLCIRKPFILNAVQENDYSKSSQTKEEFSFENDKYYDYSNDPFSLLENTKSLLEWLSSFVIGN